MSRNGWVVVAAAALAMLIVDPAPSGAQTVNAEVRTWSGQVYQLTDPTLEVYFTIVLPKKDGGGPSETATTTGARAPMLFGSAAAIGQFLDKGPDPLFGNRQTETFTLRGKDGVEIQLPLANVAALLFARQPIRSTLPHYAVGDQYRYTATAVLSDGSRIESDYANLGTTFLRGRTAHGRVDIPWDQIEVVRFTR